MNPNFKQAEHLETKWNNISSNSAAGPPDIQCLLESDGETQIFGMKLLRQLHSVFWVSLKETAYCVDEDYLAELQVLIHSAIKQMGMCHSSKRDNTIVFS